jgi:hypothetical protein
MHKSAARLSPLAVAVSMCKKPLHLHTSRAGSWPLARDATRCDATQWMRRNGKRAPLADASPLEAKMA